MSPFKKLYKNTSSLVSSLPNSFLHYKQALGLTNLFQQHLINHITNLSNALSAGDSFSRIIQYRLFQIAKDINIPFSPLLLDNFKTFSKMKIMNTNLILRIISFASEIGISFARSLQASQSVDDTLIYTLFDNNPGLYSSSLHMIKRSSIQYLSQCTSADGTVMLSYRDTFKRNSNANPGTCTPKWYQHITSHVCRNNSLRIKDEFIHQLVLTNVTSINRPFERAPVPQRNIRAAFWYSTWNNNTQSPILGKAVYTHPSSLQFQHWTPIISVLNNTSTSLTPTSSRLQLKECEGCHLNNNYTRRRTSQYLDQFPCRISCQHNDTLKLTIRPTTLFDRAATLKFNTTLANLTSDIKASFTPITDQPIQRPISRQYEYGRVSLNFTYNSVTHNINTDTRTTIKSIFDAINFQDILHLKRWETIKSFSDQSGID